MYDGKPRHPISHVKAWTFHPFERSSVSSAKYFFHFLKADITKRLSTGTVSSPQIMIFCDFEKIIMSGLNKVVTPVQVGNTRELFMSTRISQSFARLNKDGILVVVLRFGFVLDLTKDSEMCGICRDETHRRFAIATSPLTSVRMHFKTLSWRHVYLPWNKAAAQPERIWLRVAQSFPQREQEGLDFKPHLLRFEGDGSVRPWPFMRKESSDLDMYKICSFQSV